MARRTKRPLTDLDLLLEVLPPRVRASIDDPDRLCEVALDLGRSVELRYDRDRSVFTDHIVAPEDLEHVFSRVSPAGNDNRCGIEGTLHRISKVVNKAHEPVGATLRVGRPYAGYPQLLADLLQAKKSILVLGAPGAGKTSLLRGMARVLSDDLDRRVMIVDTSNEIAGEGNTPHPSLGRARRIQVPPDRQQYQVMIEAVENHNPHVVIIDEISTQEEAWAALTIAQRGVQIIATAHGKVLKDLVFNKPLAGLIGGVKTVTLSDDEAQRRGTQKTVQERESQSPPFDAVAEIRAFDEVAVHADAPSAVDAILSDRKVQPELRRMLGEEAKVLLPGTIEPAREAPEPQPYEVPQWAQEKSNGHHRHLASTGKKNRK